MCRTAHVGEQRGVWNWWTGLLGWTTGLEFSHFTNLLHALFRRPGLKSWGSKVTAYLIAERSEATNLDDSVRF